MLSLCCWKPPVTYDYTSEKTQNPIHDLHDLLFLQDVVLPFSDFLLYRWALLTYASTTLAFPLPFHHARLIAMRGPLAPTAPAWNALLAGLGFPLVIQSSAQAASPQVDPSWTYI